MLNDEVSAHLDSFNDRKSVCLYGVETHVCIRQTCLDLLEKNYDVHLVVDAVSSMKQHDRNVGIESMVDMGASLITFQSLMFELLRTMEHPHFKTMLPILKDNPANPLDLHYFNAAPKL